MLPILVDQLLDADRIEPDRLLKTIRHQLHHLTGQRAIPEPMVTQLLRQGRLLLILDGLSEMGPETVKAVGLDSNSFPATALVVTSRRAEDLDGALRIKTSLEVQLLAKAALAAFLQSYLSMRPGGCRPSEAFDASARLSRIVREQPIPALIATLYAEQMGTADGVGAGAPNGVAGLILGYLAELSHGSEPSRAEFVAAAKRIASAWMGETHYRPTPILRTTLLLMPQLDARTREALDVLIRAGVIRAPAPEADRLRFSLDPVAEYLAAMDLVGRIAVDPDLDGASKRILEAIYSQQGAPKGVADFLQVLRDCARVEGLDIEPAEAAVAGKHFAPKLGNLQKGDEESRRLAARAIGEFGTAAREALPTLLRACGDVRLSPGVRVAVIEAIDAIGIPLEDVMRAPKAAQQDTSKTVAEAARRVQKSLTRKRPNG
jgi:hypothetical protein